MTVAIKQPGGPGAGVTLQGAADAFLSSPRCENENTRRAYAGVIDTLAAQLGAGRELTDVADDEIAAALKALWTTAVESTWNRNRAAVNAWLTWCRDLRRWPAPAVPANCERRKEHVDATKDLPKAAIERQLSRRDIALREKTLWRMLYETAARAGEILALDVEQVDLDNRRAPLRSKGGELQWILATEQERTLGMDRSRWSWSRGTGYSCAGINRLSESDLGEVTGFVRAGA